MIGLWALLTTNNQHVAARSNTAKIDTSPAHRANSTRDQATAFFASSTALSTSARY